MATLIYHAAARFARRFGVQEGMALTPEQSSQLTPSDYEQVQTLEKDLDNKLIMNFHGESSPKFEYVFVTKEGGKPKAKVIFELQRRYEVAGWRVALTRSESDDIFSMTLEAASMTQPVMTVHHRLMEKEPD